MPSFETKSVWLKHCVDAGVPTPDDFEIRTTTLEVPSPLPENQILVKILTMSADPYLRSSLKSKNNPKGQGVMSGFVAGEVVASSHEQWKARDLFGVRFSIFLSFVFPLSLSLSLPFSTLVVDLDGFACSIIIISSSTLTS